MYVSERTRERETDRERKRKTIKEKKIQGKDFR